jgi:hypothetical protein
MVFASRLVRESPLLRRLTWPSQSVQIRQILAELLPSIGIDVATSLRLRGEIVEIVEDDPDGVIEPQPDSAAQLHGPDSAERTVGEKPPQLACMPGGSLRQHRCLPLVLGVALT